MSKLAIVSDIHANLEALQAVLADIRSQSIDTIYCLGDVIGYGPNPCQCIDLCFDFGLTILGNHDMGALFDPDGFSNNAEQAILWTRAQLESKEDPANRKRWDFLCALPRTRRDGKFMFVHGSPRLPLSEYVFPEDIHNLRKMEKIFSLVEQYCFQGHTHVPGVFLQSGTFVSPAECDSQYVLGAEKVMVNVGSVGQPRDGIPECSYVVLNDTTVNFRRVDYDREATIAKIHAAVGLDNSLGDRLREGR